MCSPGYFLGENDECTICPKDTYSNFDGTACIACGPGETTTGTGSIQGDCGECYRNLKYVFNN